tara:strand:- start:220 stop:411 length:192 start_codon:yes stop_codon:yes gene_type:complete
MNENFKSEVSYRLNQNGEVTLTAYCSETHEEVESKTFTNSPIAQDLVTEFLTDCENSDYIVTL